MLQQSERLRRVVGAVTALPPKQRQVIVRHALDGESHERIATDLGMSAGSIRQLVHRARRTVREAAAALFPTPLMRLLPWGSDVVEAAPAVGGGAVLAKVAVAALVAGAAGGGAVEVPSATASRARSAWRGRRTGRAARRRTCGSGSAAATCSAGDRSTRPVGDPAGAGPAEGERLVHTRLLRVRLVGERLLRVGVGEWILGIRLVGERILRVRVVWFGLGLVWFGFVRERLVRERVLRERLVRVGLLGQRVLRQWILRVRVVGERLVRGPDPPARARRGAARPAAAP